MTDWHRIGKMKDFSSDGAFGVRAGDMEICLVRLGDRYYALDNRCTHAEAQLSAGDVEEGEIACPLHGARFDLKTGRAMTPPATMPVRTHEVKVDGDDLYVRLSEIPTTP